MIFHYGGTFSDVMLNRFPTNNEIITIYKENPKVDGIPLYPMMQAILESRNIPRRTTGTKKRETC